MTLKPFRSKVKARLIGNFGPALGANELDIEPAAKFTLAFYPSGKHTEFFIGEQQNKAIANINFVQGLNADSVAKLNLVNVNINTFLPDVKEKGKVVILVKQGTLEAPKYVSLFEETLTPPFSTILSGKKTYKFQFMKMESNGTFTQVGEKEVVVP